MRNMLLASAVLGAVAIAGPANAAPATRERAAVAPHAQTVQYYDPNWREHEEWRRRREEERRREAWRREHERREYERSEARPPYYGPRY